MTLNRFKNISPLAHSSLVGGLLAGYWRGMVKSARDSEKVTGINFVHKNGERLL